MSEEKRVVIYKIDPDYNVQLGDGCNLAAKEPSLCQYVSEAYVNAHRRKSAEDKMSGSASDVRICNRASDMAKRLCGSLDMSLDVEKVANVAGKGSLSHDDVVKDNSKTMAFSLREVSEAEWLRLDDLTDDDITKENVEVTHVVTNINYGKMFAGTMSLTSRVKDSKLARQGQLEAALNKIPFTKIEGGVKYDEETKETFNQSLFEASYMASGGGSVKLVNSPAAFEKAAQDFTDSKGKNVISYTLEPIHGCKKLNRVSARGEMDKFLNERFKTALFNLKDLESYLNHVKVLADTSEMQRNILQMQTQVFRKYHQTLEAFKEGNVDATLIESLNVYSRDSYQFIKADSDLELDPAQLCINILDLAIKRSDQARAQGEGAEAEEEEEEAGSLVLDSGLYRFTSVRSGGCLQAPNKETVIQYHGIDQRDGGCWEAQDLGNSVYILSNGRHSDRKLHAPLENPKSVVQWHSSTQGSQWRLTYLGDMGDNKHKVMITNVRSGLNLHVPAGDPTSIVQSDSTTEGSEWILEGAHFESILECYIRTCHNDVMTVCTRSNNFNPHTPVVISNFSGGDKQVWIFNEQLGAIMPKNNTKMCLDVLGGQCNNGDSIGLWEWLGGHGQQWDYCAETGRFTLRHHPHLALEVPHGHYNQDTHLKLWQYCGGAHQTQFLLLAEDLSWAAGPGTGP